MVNKKKFRITNETAFYVGVFSILEPSYWLIGWCNLRFNLYWLLIYFYFATTNRKVHLRKKVSFVPEKFLIHHRYIYFDQK